MEITFLPWWANIAVIAAVAILLIVMLVKKFRARDLKIDWEGIDWEKVYYVLVGLVIIGLGIFFATKISLNEDQLMALQVVSGILGIIAVILVFCAIGEGDGVEEIAMDIALITAGFIAIIGIMALIMGHFVYAILWLAAIGLACLFYYLLFN
ncbi:MAG: hypothetical protein IKS23_05455 [Alphaproteobacteria bacterium]|nr:hypothetical protein [Alphaproteobacteria bacterium]